MERDNDKKEEFKSEIPVLPILEPIRSALDPLRLTTSRKSRPGISRTTTRASSRSRPGLSRTRSRTSSRSRTYGGQDGYSVFTPDDSDAEEGAADEEAQARIAKAEDEGEEPHSDEDKIEEGVGFIVGFDEVDPFDPKRMGKLRKWMIVLMLSASTLCV
jgi:hypothetical protein